GERAVAVVGRDAQFVQLVLRLAQGDAAVQVDLERLGGDVARRDERVDTRIHPDRSRCETTASGQLGDRLVQHFDVQLEAACGDVAGLFGAEQVAGATDLQV